MVQNETVFDSGLIPEKWRGFAGIGGMSQLGGGAGEEWEMGDFMRGKEWIFGGIAPAAVIRGAVQAGRLALIFGPKKCSGETPVPPASNRPFWNTVQSNLVSPNISPVATPDLPYNTFNTYTDISAVSGHTYVYWLTAVNQAGSTESSHLPVTV